MRTRFRPDRRLTVRMAVTMGLLAVVYVAFVAALVVLIKSILLIVLLVGGLLLAQFWFSDRIALYGMRARIVTAEEQPQLHGLVERLCSLADMPKPQIAVADMELPNAFATGRSTKRAVLCVTTGLTRRLDPEELEGVLAHELSHVAHRDVVVMTIASFLGVLAGLLARMMLYSSMFGGNRDRRDGDNFVVIVLAVMAVSAVVYAVSYLLIRALSRYRELAADRAGAILTGRPSALASALTKVSGEIARIPTRDLRAAQAFNAFFFAPALGAQTSVAHLLSTHPALERRLDQLASLSTQLGEGA
ncbi:MULTISPECIES: zinc metalloprotease HtpX [Rhodococcus]|uniref:zinc metalloprotease HtpX n=1 Tax=Rhodococcus TaxID=1827 RepID=UPI000C9CE668|nr:MULTISPECIES: zinc metalloprotease HtpX [Rhodococcus]PND52781.1 zinc metalloprotease HtpX [Rhodococcus sp. ENV425]WKX01814.1 zinc metalloprotease HtpX [Rhodococcus aetherivorans]